MQSNLMSRHSKPLKPIRIVLALLTLGWGYFAAPLAHAAQPDGAAGDSPHSRPNIVLLFADDLGYGDLSCFGHPTIRTPNLDRMASEGMRLTSFYAAPSCTPARAQLLTGRYAPRVGLPHVLLADNPNGLKDSEITFAEALRERGYRTMMVGKWHLGHTKEEYWPTAQGFDSFFGLPYSHDIMKPWVQTDVPMRLYRNREVVEEYPDPSTLTTRYTEEAARLIEEASQQEEPFFLYFAYNMPHLPLGAPERFRNRSAGGLFGDVTEMIDWSVGEIRAALEANGVAENTLVIFTSDNGPWAELPPRMLSGGVERWHHGTTGPLRGSKGSTWEGGMRVPAIAWWPNAIPAGRTSSEPASVLDVLPTFVSLAGGELPSDRTLDGYDLTPLLTGQTDDSPRDHLYYFLGENLQALRVGPWKFRNVRGQGKQLYHLERDPGEKYNVADQHPQLIEQLEQRLNAFRKELAAK